MKKENKKLAQERRAKQRQKDARKNMIMRWIWIPIAIVVVILIIALLATQSTTSTSSSTTTTTTAATTASSKTLSTDTSLVVQDGDTVNIDYIGYVDGVEFTGGNTEGAGADLTIGSGTYISGFEEQIIGHKVGETFDITVTFPDGYGDTTTVDGKSITLSNAESVFTITLNGIYQ